LPIRLFLGGPLHGWHLPVHPANLGFSRKDADDNINFAKWHVAYFDAGRADKEARLVTIQQDGGKCVYRHDGYTGFNAVLETLSKRATKVKAASKPAEKGQRTAKTAKPPKIIQKQKLVLLQTDNVKLLRAVQSFDPKHSILNEVNMSILPEGKPVRDVEQK
jgi:hypothetical protein